MRNELTIYRVGFNGNDETEVHAEYEDEAVEIAKEIAREDGMDFELDYVEACGLVNEVYEGGEY